MSKEYICVLLEIFVVVVVDDDDDLEEKMWEK